MRKIKIIQFVILTTIITLNVYSQSVSNLVLEYSPGLSSNFNSTVRKSGNLSPVFSNAITIRKNFELSNNLYLSVGFSYAEFGEKINNIIFSATFNGSIVSLGPPLKNNNNSPILDWSKKYTYIYGEIPILLNYGFKNIRFTTGPIWNIHFNSSVKHTYTYEDNTKDVESFIDNSKSHSISLYQSIEYLIKINDALTFSTGPSFNYFLKETSIFRSPYRIGWTIGITLRK